MRAIQTRSSRPRRRSLGSSGLEGAGSGYGSGRAGMTVATGEATPLTTSVSTRLHSLAASERLPPPSMPDTLDFALIKRLREVMNTRVTETELRTLKEQAEAWARTVSGQLQASERRIRRLNANPASSLAQIAGELRRVETLRPQLNEVRSLLADLEDRTRELRTEWLLSQASASRRAPSGDE
jgi:hypothetical protein